MKAVNVKDNIFKPDILIVDNNEENLKLLVDLLTDNGYSVRPANSGELALRSARKALPALILLDVKMPKMDGFEICRQLKTDERTRPVPVIFITIAEQEADKLKGFELGAADYITKPFNSVEVLARVRVHIEIQRMFYENRIKSEMLEAEITQRKQIEKEFQKVSRNLSMAQEVASIGSWSFNLETGVVFWSDEMFKIFGLDPKNGPPTWPDGMEKLYYPDDWKWAIKLISDSIANNKSYDIYDRYYGADGSVRWAHVVGRIFNDPDGKPAYYVGVMQDVNENRKYEENLRISEARYRSFVEATQLIVWVTDSSGQVIEDVPWLRKFSGQSYEEAKGSGWAKALHPDDLERTFAVWNKAVSAKSKYETEYRMRRHDGVYRNLLARGFPVFRNDGSILEWIGICIDITELREFEEMKSNLIRDVSHELKTPVAMMDMAYKLYEKAMEGGDMAQVKKAHEMASKNLKRLKKDINNILDMFSLGRLQVPEKTDVDLKKIIDEIISDSQGIIADKKLKWETDVPRELKGPLISEKEIRILLNNIIDNAIKFTERGSILISAVLKDKFIEIKVKDTGCGIEPDEKDKIFTGFYKIHKSLPGTGLGLLICKEIVKRHNGKIEVISEGAEKGATVTISLPAD